MWPSSSDTTQSSRASDLELGQNQDLNTNHNMDSTSLPTRALNSEDESSKTTTPAPSLHSSNDKETPLEILSFTPSDPRNPYNWSPARKWLVASCSLVGTLLLPLNGTSIAIASHEIAAEFNVSDTSVFTNTYWTISSWTLGGAAFIIVCLALMEDIGVKRGYMIFYAFFLAMVIPQAVAPNYATLVITRIFTGGCVATLANTICSVIPDMWATPRARSLPISTYILLYVLGNQLGPVVFAPVVQYGLSWRWIFYIQLITYAVLFPFFFFTILETRGHIILRDAARSLRKQSPTRKIFSRAEISQVPVLQALRKSVVRPAYLLFTEPLLLASTVWSAFCFGLVFSFTQSVEQVFSATYNFTPWQCGYLQGFICGGEVLGFLANQYGTHLFFASATRNTESPGRPIPEARLYVSIFGSFFGITGGMFVYAWTTYPHIHWIAPSLGLAMVGFGIQVVVSTIADYVTDAYASSGYAGSAISAVAAGEYVFSAFLPLASQSMYTNLGFQWASTLLGCLALGLSFVPVVFVWKGRSLRERSPFIQTQRAEDEDVEEQTGEKFEA